MRPRRAEVAANAGPARASGQIAARELVRQPRHATFGD
jgi:hypothetical protein